MSGVGEDDVPTGPYGPKYPARRLLELIGDKWTAVVLYSLSDEVKRFSALQRDIPDISKKMLIQTLQTLESGGLVERTVYPTVPPQTDYRLTSDGKTLHAPIAALCSWAGRNELLLDIIHERRSTHRAATS